MEMNLMVRQFVLCLPALLLAGCRSLETAQPSGKAGLCEQEPIIFTKTEIQTRSWLLESGSRAIYNSSKILHFPNHEDILAATYTGTNDSGSKCVDFYTEAGNDHYILLVHDSSHLPIESIESVEQKGNAFVEI